MKSILQKPFSKYYTLRKEIDSLCLKLENVHKKHLNCKMGCDLCCMAISVFPVEFYAIKAELDPHSVQNLPNQTDDSQCSFLVDHRCTIYGSRPVICRTHGLPLLYMGLESDDYELSLCELNFTEFDFEDFDEENTYPMDQINSQLYLINKKFVAGFENGKYSEKERIPLAQIAKLTQG